MFSYLHAFFYRTDKEKGDPPPEKPSRISAALESTVQSVASYLEYYEYLKTFNPKDIIKLLDSFKEVQVSQYLDTIHDNIMMVLASPNMSPRIAPYFKAQHPIGIPYPSEDYTQDTHQVTADPDTVSQIKKLINALYYARVTFKDLESLDTQITGKNWADIRTLYNQTMHDAYKASYLLTHLEINPQEIFGDDIVLLQDVMGQIMGYMREHIVDTDALKASLKSTHKSHTLGTISGIAIDQMGLNSTTPDYKFLTEFSAILPKKIDELTQIIKKYSDKIRVVEPTLNNEQMQQLQNEALQLLNSLEQIRVNNPFAPLSFLNYMRIINHIIELSVSALNQIKHVSSTSQDVLREKLAALKYGAFPELFGLVDKMEVHALLKPGTLSTPLMQKTKALYATLIYYAKIPIDFEESGRDLLEIENELFLSLRQEYVCQRMGAVNFTLLAIARAEHAKNEWYKILEQPIYAQYSIHQLPLETRNQLTAEYLLFRDYLRLIDIELDKVLVDSLKGQRPNTWTSYITGRFGADHVHYILAHKQALQDLMDKKRNSELFYNTLNQDLLQHITQVTDTALVPFSGESSVFTIDEQKALSWGSRNRSPLLFDRHGAPEADKKLKPHTASPLAHLHFDEEHGATVVINPNALSASQSFALHQWYKHKQDALDRAKTKYIELVSLLQAAQGILSPEDKIRCRHLYSLIQPYFMSALATKYKKKGQLFDAQCVQALNDLNHTTAPAHDMLYEQQKPLVHYATKIHARWERKSQYYREDALHKYSKEQRKGTLEHPHSDARAHFVLQHTRYSKALNAFRIELIKVQSLLNNTIQAALAHKVSGSLPFPELEYSNNMLAQPKQIIAMKRIYNTVFHAEHLIIRLEQLDNKSYELTYVFHLIKAYQHINELRLLLKELASDPHISLIAHQLHESAHSIFSCIQEHSDAYIVAPERIDKRPICYNPLWYTLNAFYLLPPHVRRLDNHTYLATEELKQLQQQVKDTNVRVEQIINHSDSYFKILLNIPGMYVLYAELKKRANEFISTIHDTSINRLRSFKADFVTPILLLASQWEDTIGFKPGILTDPLQQVTDEYFKGLIQALNLDSKTHVALMADNTSWNQQSISNRAYRNHSRDKLKKLETAYQPLLELVRLIHTLPVDNMPLQVDTQLITAYKEALPILANKHKPLPLQLEEGADALDNLLNQHTKEYEPKLKYIKALILAHHAQYLGEKATLVLRIDTSKERSAHLTRLAETQKNAHQNYLQEYTTTLFYKHVKAYSERHIGLQYTDEEYQNKLKAHLERFKHSIIDQARNQEDISLSIQNALKEHIRTFEEEHYAHYYHLDTVRVALAQFKNYFSDTNASIAHQKSFFELEDNTTIEKKSLWINKLLCIAEDKQLPITERFAKITQEVINPNFSRVILAHKEVHTLSFDNLVHCFIALLEALHVYYAPPKALHHALNKAVTTKPQLRDLYTRFNLFTVTGPTETTSKTPISQTLENPSI